MVWPVVGQVVGATVAGEIEGNENSLCSKLGILQVMLPEHPAIWEAVDEDDKAGATVDAGAWKGADIVQLDVTIDKAEIVCQAIRVFR